MQSTMSGMAIMGAAAGPVAVAGAFMIGRGILWWLSNQALVKDRKRRPHLRFRRIESVPARANQDKA